MIKESFAKKHPVIFSLIYLITLSIFSAVATTISSSVTLMIVTIQCVFLLAYAMFLDRNKKKGPKIVIQEVKVMNKRLALERKENLLTMDNIRKTFNNIIWVLFLTILLLGIPRLASIIVSPLDFQQIDPDGAYAWLSVRHIVISFLVIILMGIINTFKPMDYGIGWGDKETGKKYTLSFLKYFCIYTIGAFITVIATNSFQQFEYALTAANITGHLGFQLLLSGFVEELLFRGFSITLLTAIIRGRVFNGKVSIANLIAAVIFGLAHIGILFNPFEIRYSIFQVLYAIVLGLFYGDCYEKSNSVFYPMIMHSFTNVVMVGTAIILSFIL